MHLNKDRREKGRHAPKAVEAINLDFATDCTGNTSGYKLLIEGTNQIVVSIQSLLSKRADELVSTARAYVAKLNEVPMAADRVRGISASIDPKRPPKNYNDAMSRKDHQEWAAAYDNEYPGFYEHQAFKIARQEPGAKIVGSTTRTEYKVVNGVFKKQKIRLCVMGNQQK